MFCYWTIEVTVVLEYFVCSINYGLELFHYLHMLPMHSDNRETILVWAFSTDMGHRT